VDPTLDVDDVVKRKFLLLLGLRLPPLGRVAIPTALSRFTNRVRTKRNSVA
jgi:hypothetical protein